MSCIGAQFARAVREQHSDDADALLKAAEYARAGGRIVSGDEKVTRARQLRELRLEMVGRIQALDDARTGSDRKVLEARRLSDPNGFDESGRRRLR